MKTKKQKAQDVLDGLLRPEDTTHGTLEIVLQMCKDAGLNELYTAVEPIYLQKKQEFNNPKLLIYQIHLILTYILKYIYQILTIHY